MSATVATVAYIPPLATASPSTFTDRPTNVNYGTSTAQPGNTNIYLYYFIVPYLDAHVLSPPSWRYAYIFWIVISVVFVLWTVLHQLNKYATLHTKPNPTQARTSILTRFFRSILIRRLIPTSASSPNQRSRWYASTLLTFGQLLTLLAFSGIILAVSLAGFDYISPTTCTWGGPCAVQVFHQGPPKSSYTPLRFRRRHAKPSSPPLPQPAEKFLKIPQPEKYLHQDHQDSFVEDEKDRGIEEPLQSQDQLAFHRLLPRASALSLNPGGWAPFNDPLLAAPNYDIPRNMWTISSRFGLIAYALLPFVVTLGLKAWPFNIFATPWLTNYGFDKSAVIHRWIGRLIWIWSTIHTITFTIQLTRDYNPYGRMILTDVWQYYRFNWGVVAYIALTFIVALSFNPFRDRYYELFYCSHVILSILCLVGCIVHYEPLWAWSVIALALWGAERAARLVIWFWINGLFSSKLGPRHFWASRPPNPTQLTLQNPTNQSSPRISLFAYGFVDLEPTPAPYSNNYQPDSPRQMSFNSSNPPLFQSGLQPKTPTTYIQIPPGFALAQVLPGETVRLTLNPIQSKMSWNVGQYVLVCLPSLGWWQTHPYTISNSYTLSKAEEKPEIVLIVRARGGLTRRLYDRLISSQTGKSSDTNGVLMRCQISQPFGSSSRIGWMGFENVIVICGGSGISFGIGLLEELCASFSGVGQVSRVRRIRFVWILRDHAHLSWVAPALRRCLLMVTPDQVRVDLYVSSSNSNSIQNSRSTEDQSNKKQQVQEKGMFDVGEEDDRFLLVPPNVPFGQHSDFSPRSSGELSITDRAASPTPSSKEDLTEFEGERQVRSEFDEMVSENVKTIGKQRRRNTISKRNQHQYQNQNDRSESRVGLIESENKIMRKSKRSVGIENGGFDINEVERLDIEDLSEIVRVGKVDLREILGIEISRSVGKSMVACCGPSRLSGIVRGLVADRVKEGNQVEIYTEDFSY